MHCEDGVQLYISYVILFYPRGIYQRRDAIGVGSVASTCPLFLSKTTNSTARSQSVEEAPAERSPDVSEDDSDKRLVRLHLVYH